MCSNVSSKKSESTNVCAVQETGATSARIDVKKEPPVNELILLSLSTFLAFMCFLSEGLSPRLQILRPRSNGFIVTSTLYVWVNDFRQYQVMSVTARVMFLFQKNRKFCNWRN